MTTRPLPFKDWKARLIAELEPGELIQTRRRIKNQHKDWKYVGMSTDLGYPASRKFVWAGFYLGPDNESPSYFKCPHGVSGDTIWVREAYRFGKGYDGLKPSLVPKIANIFYEADGDPPEWAGKKRHGMFLPKVFSRSLLKIVEVRVEQIQKISYEDILDEGWDARTSEPITEGTAGEDARAWFENVWDGFYKDTPYAWELNPVVWVLTLRKE